MYIKKNNEDRSIIFAEDKAGVWISIAGRNSASISLKKDDVLSMAEELVLALGGGSYVINPPAGGAEAEKIVAKALAKAAGHDFDIALYGRFVAFDSLLRKGSRVGQTLRTLEYWEDEVRAREDSLHEAVLDLETAKAIRNKLKEKEDADRALKLTEARTRVMEEAGYPHDRYEVLTFTTKKLIDRVIEAEGLVG